MFFLYPMLLAAWFEGMAAMGILGSVVILERIFVRSSSKRIHDTKGIVEMMLKGH